MRLSVPPISLIRIHASEPARFSVWLCVIRFYKDTAVLAMKTLARHAICRTIKYDNAGDLGMIKKGRYSAG
jgi:hypothetical protein